MSEEGKHYRHGWACVSEDCHVGPRLPCDCGLDELEKFAAKKEDGMKEGDFGHDGALTGRVTVDAVALMAAGTNEGRKKTDDLFATQNHVQLLLLIEIRDLLEQMAGDDR